MATNLFFLVKPTRTRFIPVTSMCIWQVTNAVRKTEGFQHVLCRLFSPFVLEKIILLKNSDVLPLYESLHTVCPRSNCYR